MEEQKDPIRSIVSTAVRVITDPWGFYSQMPKAGGYKDPLLFLAAMLVVSTAVSFLAVLLRAGFKAFLGGLPGLIIVPVIGVIASFIAAGIFFVIWKLMGSQESYETAYRSIIYCSAIAPLTTLLSLIPYLGSAASTLWGAYLVIVASLTVHQIRSTLAWGVWGILAVFLVLSSWLAQSKARRFSAEMAGKAQEMEQTAKEMEKAALEWQKKMEEAARKMQEEMAKQQK